MAEPIPTGEPIQQSRLQPKTGVRALTSSQKNYIKGMWENVLVKEFFGSVDVERGQVGGSGRWATGASSRPWG